jgi:hypothetical protein
MINRNKRRRTKASDCIASAIRILQRPCHRIDDATCYPIEHETFRTLQNVYKSVRKHEDKQNGGNSRG